MAVDAATALRAYGANIAQAARTAAEGPNAAPQAAGGADFAGLVSEALQSTEASLKNAESMSVAQATGQGELVDVVTAVAAAEVTLETVVAVRDQVISAYQEILRMPI